MTAVALSWPSGLYRNLALRFLARFSGRRRMRSRRFYHRPPPWTILAWFILLTTSMTSVVDGCSSRSTPKPRPVAPVATARPNITFLTYECPPAYAAWYCLNGATCFTVKIGDSLLYNCECSEGYMGPRCEYKDLDGSYLPSQRRILLETASIAGGAAIAVFLVVVFCVVAFIHYRRRHFKHPPIPLPVNLRPALPNASPNKGAWPLGVSATADCVDGGDDRVPSACPIRAHAQAPIFGVRLKRQNNPPARLEIVRLPPGFNPELDRLRSVMTSKTKETEVSHNHCGRMYQQRCDKLKKSGANDIKNISS